LKVAFGFTAVASAVACAVMAAVWKAAVGFVAVAGAVGCAVMAAEWKAAVGFAAVVCAVGCPVSNIWVAVKGTPWWRFLPTRDGRGNLVDRLRPAASSVWALLLPDLGVGVAGAKVPCGAPKCCSIGLGGAENCDPVVAHLARALSCCKVGGPLVAQGTRPVETVALPVLLVPMTWLMIANMTKS
jgi:hypothetical protein